MKTNKTVETLVVILFFFLSGCSLNDTGGSASFTLKMPDGFNKSSKVVAYSQNSCFAVSITGDGLPSTPVNDCDPNYGLFAGLINAGGSVTLEVEQGKDRTIDIFYISSESGCSDFDIINGLGKTFGTNKVYRIGHMENIDLDQEDMNIEVVVQMPSVSNALSAVEPGLPVSCKKTNPLPNAYQATWGSQGAGVFDVPSTGTKMKLRITDKSLNLSTAGPDRLLPIGVEL